VFSELLSKHLHVTNLQTVFPRYRANSIDLLG
jgi:hypothetical protein